MISYSNYSIIPQMDYINTSHPNFIGGSKALEIAVQQSKSSRAAIPVSRQKVYLLRNMPHIFMRYVL